MNQQSDAESDKSRYRDEPRVLTARSLHLRPSELVIVDTTGKERVFLLSDGQIRLLAQQAVREALR